MKSTILVMTGLLHQKLKHHLFPGDGLEAAAILLCNQGSGKQHHRLIATEMLALPHCRSHREAHFLAWPFGEHLPPDKISEIDSQGQSVITIHSHPNGYDKFSPTDDRNDKELFPSICNWFDDGRPNGSAIMLPNGEIRARTVDAQGIFKPMPTVAVIGDDIRIWKPSTQREQAGYHKKLSQTFGKGTLDLLRGMRVGVVGCSGTGSIIIELLARNCVGSLVLADNDVVEEKNLNRIINSTTQHARQGLPKTLAIKKAIQGIGMSTKVDAYQELTDSRSVIEAIIDCDAVFGCVDGATGKYHLDCLASAYCIPYFDVGVQLDADGEGGINVADAVSHYRHPEGSSLLSRGAYTREQLHAEDMRKHNPQEYQKRRAAGYLLAVGEEQPAVMSINMQAACMAFNDFLARVQCYRLDANREFETQYFRLKHGCYGNAEGSEPKMDAHFKKYMGTGDKSLLVNTFSPVNAKSDGATAVTECYSQSTPRRGRKRRRRKR